MSNRKFHALFVIWLMILVALFAGGCGGSSGGSLGIVDNNPTPNPTPIVSPDPTPTPIPTPVPTPIVSPDPTPTPVPIISPDPVPDPSPTYFTVTFDSNGGSYVDGQEVEEEERAVQPDDPEFDGHVFVRWVDENGDTFNFDSPVYGDLILIAEWTELDEVTEEESALIQEAVFGGRAYVSFDSSPLSSVDVTYDFADASGFVEISEVTDGPILNTAGLIGSPVNIKSDLSEFKETAITFHYDPELLTVSPNDLGIVWYDESNDRMVLLSKDVTLDTSANTIKLSSDHFSIYGLVSVSQWEEIWSKRLPTFRSGDVKYNVILVIDCSGSMSYSDVNAAVSSAQNLVDSLSDEDYASVLAFGLSYYENVTEIISTTKISGNKQVIKDSMSSLYPSGGTYIAEALTRSLQYKMSDTSYKNLVVLLSDGEDNVDDSILYTLKDNGMKVITVGLGRYLDQALMERIASITEGSYLYASSSEQLEDKFREVANTDFGLDAADNDHDGLPDALEEAGMRDFFGHEWKTDSKDEDSDNDGLKDGEEIIFNPLGYSPPSYSPFSLVAYRSNPNLTTEKVNSTNISIPQKVYCVTDDISARRLTLRFSVTSYIYKEQRDKEIFYLQAEDKDLKYEVVDLPEGFSVSSGVTARKSNTKLTEDGTQNAEVDYYAEFTVRYPENQSRTLKTVNLRHIDDTPGAMELTYLDIPVEYANTQVRSYVVDSAKAAAERLEAQYIRALMKEIREVQQDNTAMKDSASSLRALAKAITPIPILGTTTKAPSQVIQVFAEAIERAVEKAKTQGYNVDINEWNRNPLKCVTTFMKDWAEGIANIFTTETQTVTVGGTTYTVTMKITSMEGIGYGDATVSAGNKRWQLLWASNMKEINTALGNYCAMLLQLSENVIEQFWTIYINSFLGEIGSSKQVSQTMVHNAGLVIKILGSSGREAEDAAKELAQSALQYVNSKTQAVLKDKLQKITGKEFELEIESFVNNLPDGKGKKFMENAQKLKKILEKYDELKEAIGAFASFSHGSGGSVSQAITDAEKAYSGFKSVYDKLNDDDLFSDKVPLIDFLLK